ncbi:MFS transporter [Lysinibacillus xylanilyticus]|uniref:MFS transporter n=1 Tax=Lysinibacillus xylanilyticus TaxID=582475 RepID=A0ABT4EQY9_9BACI|nr:MFS transporter [Lysinibacillus xylanilyticus]MCY9548077.1 MFS transporter [Lysinibacillus xylanilyticus]MED3804924.1 MFS transporter [Lysinibacillus xylanilyticus]
MSQSEKPSAKLTLLALAISAFGIGSTEFISVGLLPLITEDFGISLSTAGLIVSIYALAVTVGAPLLTAFTSHLSRKTVLLLVMAIFIVGNLTAAIAPLFSILIIGRIISALAHGVFMSIASVIAADVVEPNKRASAIAFMFTGLTLATVTGVPLGTFIGQITDWRMSFIFIVIIGVIGLISNALLVPSQLSKGNPISLRDIGKVLGNFRMLLIFFITAMGFGGAFVVYTYVSPILEQYMGYSPHAVVIILVVYGIFVAIGNTLGGRFANQNPLRSIFIIFVGLALALLGIGFTLESPIIGLIMVLIVGLFMFMNSPGLQLYAVMLSEKYVPSAISMASALNISAFNIGIFLGSYIGGFIIRHQSLAHTPLYGFLMVMLAAIVTLLWLIFDKKKQV